MLRLLLNTHHRVDWSIGEFFFTTEADCVLQERILYESLDRTPVVECEITRGRIRKGQRVKILMGNYSGRGRNTYAPRIATSEAPAILQVKISPSGQFRTVAEVKLTFIPAEPARLNLRAVSPSSAGPLILAAVDEFNNAVSNLEDNVLLQVQNERATTNKTARTKLAGGKSVLRNWLGKKSAAGPFLLRAASRGGLSSETAAVWPGFYSDIGRNVYFGDMHLHSNGSNDGLNSPPWAYDYARNVAGLAFCSITDHAYHLLENGSWKTMRQAACKANVPHEFVTFLGYEYDGCAKAGHMGVHYKDDAPEVIVAESYPALWERLKKAGGEFFTCPHHPNAAAERLPLDSPAGWRPFDWNFHDEERQPLAEIVQERGIFERETSDQRTNGGYGASLQSALRRGYHIGFIGGSDTHLGRPGTPSFSSWRKRRSDIRVGITAVIANELTRDSLWTAMKNRNTYATTGTRMLLDFRINHLLMGDRAILSGREPPRIHIRALAPAPVVHVAVIKNGTVFREFSPNTHFFEMSLTEEKPFAHSLPCVSEECDLHSYYYVRVTQEDGQQAWASPIFLCHTTSGQ